jgi:hypothetical protein
MPSLLRARTEIADVEVLTHSPATATTACEWWRRSCIGFTSGGMWEVRSRLTHPEDGANQSQRVTFSAISGRMDTTTGRRRPRNRWGA